MFTSHGHINKPKWNHRLFISILACVWAFNLRPDIYMLMSKDPFHSQHQWFYWPIKQIKNDHSYLRIKLTNTGNSHVKHCSRNDGPGLSDVEGLSKYVWRKYAIRVRHTGWKCLNTHSYDQYNPGIDVHLYIRTIEGLDIW